MYQSVPNSFFQCGAGTLAGHGWIISLINSKRDQASASSAAMSSPSRAITRS